MKPPFAELNPDSRITLEPPPEGPLAQTSLALLQAVYRDPAMPLTTRMRAATVAIAYEHPKLSIGVRADHRGMGDAMEAAIRKSEAAKPVVAAPPVVSSATFRRVAERAMSETGREGDIGPIAPRRKPG
jgi:hypothetical protein